MSKILIIAPSWVGDTVMAQPLFRRLHERHPNLTLDVLAPGWTLPLLQRMPEVSNALLNPFGHGELKLAQRFRLGLLLRSRRYDQAIVLPNSLKSALIPFFAGIPKRTGFVGEARWLLLNDVRKLNEKALPLMAERFALLAEEKNKPLQLPLPALSLSSSAEQRQAVLRKVGISPNHKPAAAFCIGAEYGPAKRWPAAHFARLAELLAEKGYDIWLIGSPKDREIGEEVARRSAAACRNLCGETSLEEAIDLLASAALIVSNDSGLMHVAAALGKPLIALYGSSSPGFTPPLSSRARVVSLDLSCGPCFERECPLWHFNCMTQLTPEMVLKEIHEINSAPAGC